MTRLALVLLVLALATPAAAAGPAPLRLQERCLTKAEKKHPFRFQAPDGVRLVGLLLGKGTDAVVLGRARGMKTVQLMGASFGAGTGLAAAPRISPPVDSIVSLSSPRSMGAIDPEDGARVSTAPVLFAAGEDDPPFADDARAMYTESPAPDKRLAVVPAGGHGTSLVGVRRPLDGLVEAYLREHAGRQLSK